MSKDHKSKVAVVVVHGVAYHAPGASAQAASELLHGLRLNNQPSPYGPDVQETVSIPLRQLSVPKLPEPAEGWMDRHRILGFFARALQERTAFLTRAWRAMPIEEEQRTEEQRAEEAADAFMRLLLQDYRGVDNLVTEPVKPAKDRGEVPSYVASYVTTRIKLTRNEEPLPAPLTADTPRSKGPRDQKPQMGPPASTTPQDRKKEVHIYEMYWADLSRPKNTLLSFFQALYQLLFHVGSLSRLAISTGANVDENRKRKVWKWLEVWRWLDWIQLWAVRILTLPIPILNVILFISLVGTLPHLIYGDEWVRRAATVLSVVIGLVVCAITSKRLPATPWLATWVAIPFIFAAIFGAFAWFLAGQMSPWSLLAVEGWIVGVAIIYLSATGYDEVRDGAKEVAWALYGVSLTTFLAILYLIRNDKTSLEQATLWMMQIVLAALRASWILLILFAFAALILGSIAWRTLPTGPARGRAKAAVRTSRFALAMPTLGILIVTLALWSALFVKTTNKPACSACPSSSLATKLFGAEVPETLRVKSGLSWLVPQRNVALAYGALAEEQGQKSASPDAYFRGVFVWGATPAFPLVLILIFVAFFLLFLWLVPSILTERQPPRGSDNAFSRRMGAWLSRGLDATVFAVFLIWTAAFVLPLLFAVLHEPFSGKFNGLDYPTALTLQWLGLATGSAAILASLAKSGSSVLGIILDVDNYLRTSPKERTPRARIVERYVSLLRYLSDDSQKHGGYDRTVILAHSLGALISGDLLLYLSSQGDPGLAPLGLAGPASKKSKKIDIRLFTMGDPLRQFLNRFFPYLYEWVRGVREVPDNTLNHLGQRDPTPTGTPLDAPPHPSRLGVDLWINAYRSGDYIGRSIWLNEWYDRSIEEPGAYPNQGIYVAMNDVANPRFGEMCIGAGAHQHYWDQSAPDIAEKLDFLIAT